MPFQPLSTEDQPPEGTLPVLLGATPPTGPRRPSTFKPLGGKEAAFEKPGPPEWLAAIQQYVAPPVGGMVAAGAAAPLAVAAGPLAPGVEANAFAAGSMLTEEAMRQLSKTLGYRVPRARTSGENVAEFALQGISYPIGNLLAQGVSSAGKGLLGITSRRAGQNIAEKEMTDALGKINDLHRQVGSIADLTEGRISKIPARVEKGVRREIKERVQAAPEAMIGGIQPLTEEQAAARARNLAASAGMRGQEIRPIERAQRLVQLRLSREYEKMLRPYLNKEVPQDALTELAGWANQVQADAEQYRISPGLRRIIARVASWGETPPTAGLKTGESISTEEYRSLLQGGLKPDAIARGKQVLPTGEQPEPVTWKMVKRVKGELRPYFQSTESSERGAAGALEAGVTAAYEKGGFPVDPALNARYRDWRSRWGAPEIRALYRARTPEELSKVVNESALGPLIEDVPNSRPAVARIAAATIRNEKLMPSEIVKRFQPGILRDIFGQGADDIAMWSKIDAQVTGLDTLFKAAPDLQTRFTEEVQRSAQKAWQKGATQVQTHTVSLLRSLGEPAKGLANMVSNMTPQDATRFYLEVVSHPEFGKMAVTAARENVPLMPPRLKIGGLGSIPFAAGLGALELYRRGEITSPYVAAVPFALGAEAASGLIRRAIIQLAERDGIRAASQLLDRAWNPTTRKVAMSKLGRGLGQLIASDSFRAFTTPEYEQEQPQAGAQ